MSDLAFIDHLTDFPLKTAAAGASMQPSTNVSNPANIAIQAFTKSLRHAPGVSSAMWPSTTNSTQLAECRKRACRPHPPLIRFLEAGLQLIMSDVPTFITFAGAGLFSGETGIEIIPPNVTNPDQFPPSTPRPTPTLCLRFCQNTTSPQQPSPHLL